MSEDPLAVNLLDVTRSLILGRVHLIWSSFAITPWKYLHLPLLRQIQNYKEIKVSGGVGITYSRSSRIEMEELIQKSLQIFVEYPLLMRWYLPDFVQSKQRAFFDMHLLFSFDTRVPLLTVTMLNVHFCTNKDWDWRRMFNFGLF